MAQNIHQSIRRRTRGNNIYTGEQEITIRRGWHNEKGYTGKDIILKYEMLIENRFAIYFTCNDGFRDSINVDNIEEGETKIKEMIERKEVKEISCCRIYANGEYGKIIKVL